jgi:hypothetical protein
MPVPPDQTDEYDSLKVQVEAMHMVLVANGHDGLHSVAIRSAGIFR